MSRVMDPATDGLLAEIHAQGGRPLYEQTVEQVRALVRDTSAVLSPPRLDVASSRDLVASAMGREVRIRVLTPVAASTPLPIIVFFHGGGFAAGDVDTHDSLTRHLAHGAGAIVVSVDYARPPEQRFPAAVDDAYAAVVWVAEHAGAIGGDASRLAVAGDSAGGNLAAVVCLMARERGGPRIAHQTLFYPLVDFTLTTSPSRTEFGGGDYFLSNADMEWFRGLYLENVAQAADPRVSPLLARDLSGLPPAQIIAAGCDPLLDEGRAYAERLRAAGVPVDYRVFDGTIHAFAAFAGVLPVGLEALDLAATTLQNTFVMGSGVI